MRPQCTPTMLQQQARPSTHTVALEVNSIPKLPHYIPQRQSTLVSSQVNESMAETTSSESGIDPISDILARKLEQLQGQKSVGDIIAKTDNTLTHIHRKWYLNQLSVSPSWFLELHPPISHVGKGTLSTLNFLSSCFLTTMDLTHPFPATRWSSISCKLL